MDYKKAIRQIIDRRKDALDKAENVYFQLVKNNAKLGELEREKRLGAVAGDDEKYLRAENEIKKILQQLGLIEVIYPKCECQICQDTAFVGGKICSCVKKLVINSQATFELNSFSQSKVEIFGQNAPLYLSTQNTLQALCSKFPNNKMKNVVLMGKTGTGKTFLASCMANAIMQKGYSVMFLTAFETVEKMLKYHTTFDNTKTSYLAPLLDCDLLVIDDLGSESLYKNVTVEYFFHIINERRLSGKTTVITTNLSLNEIALRYGERTASRLFDKKSCYAKEFDFTDTRKINIS